MNTIIGFTCGKCGEDAVGVLATFRDGNLYVPRAFGDQPQPASPAFQWALLDDVMLMAWRCQNCTTHPDALHYSVLDDAQVTLVAEEIDPATGQPMRMLALPPTALLMPQ